MDKCLCYKCAGYTKEEHIKSLTLVVGTCDMKKCDECDTMTTGSNDRYQFKINYDEVD